MAEYKISVGNELLPRLLSEGNGVAKLVEAVLNQVLEALGASAVRSGKATATALECEGCIARGAGELAGAASARWQLLHRHLQALPTLGAGLCAGAHGNGGERRLHAQGYVYYGGAVRGELLPVDGERAVHRTRSAGAGVQ